MPHPGLLALTLGCADPAAAPGAAVPTHPLAMRRLNRAEYDRTVRDLLGTGQRPARDFPPDDSAHGFDNDAAALAVSPLWVEMADEAAGRLAAEITTPALERPVDERLEAESAAFTSDGPEWNHPVEGGFLFGSNGGLTTTWSVPQAGRYRLTVLARGLHAGDDGVLVELAVDGRAVLTATIPPTTDGWTELTTELPLTPHPAAITVAFGNDLYDAELGLDRNLLVDAVRVEGPLDFDPIPNPAWDRVMVCRPDRTNDRTDSAEDARACARTIVEAFAPRAWRRPVTAAEIDRLLARYDEVIAAGDPPLDGVEWTLRQILASPHFLFLVPGPTADDGRADPYTLASRLSYFLWSSMPDEELFARAADGTLTDPAELRRQVRRMLGDERSSAFVEDFGGQWLPMRLLDVATPDPVAWPTWSEPLRVSMRGELSALMASFVGTDRSLRELLVSDTSFVDGNLATHYGVNGTILANHREADVSAVERGGLLGAAGLHTALSWPLRTSPVKRGVWVLSNLLCDEPPPAPPDVPGFPAPSEGAVTVRDRLEAHRADPACAGCHNLIDPLGLAFEHFDGIGAWRDEEAGVAIDATGEAGALGAFDGARELAAAIANDPRYPRCVVEKLWTWGHGQAPGEEDEAAVQAVLSAFLADDMTLESAIVAIVTGDTFRGGGR